MSPFPLLRQLLRMVGGLRRASDQSQTLAAGILGIHPTSLLRRLKEEHLDN